MVQLRLPKNSRVLTGKTWPKPEGVSNIRKFKIYRGHLMMTKTLVLTHILLIWIHAAQ